MGVNENVAIENCLYTSEKKKIDYSSQIQIPLTNGLQTQTLRIKSLNSKMSNIPLTFLVNIWCRRFVHVLVVFSVTRHLQLLVPDLHRIAARIVYAG